jgi:hypothetical protein
MVFLILIKLGRKKLAGSSFLAKVFARQFSYLENSPCEWSFQKRQFFYGHPDEEIETLLLAIL